MKSSESVDIVLATLGREHELPRLLDSLASQDHSGVRLIVVDQSGSEELASVLARHAAGLPVIHLRSEPGLSRGRNVGLDHVTADVVGFADDDCWYPDGLFARVAALFDAHPEWDGITGRVEDERGRHAAARFGREAGPVDRGNVWTRGVSISLFLRRAVVERVGSFDETLGLGAGTPWGSGEETDYLLRALEAGFRLWFEPGVVVGHPQKRVDRATASEGSSYGRGMGRVLRKHGYPWWVAAYHVARALGGALLQPRQACFHLGVAEGRAAGWLAPRPR